MKDLKTCRVFNDVNDYVKSDERPAFNYNEDEVNMLSLYGYILEVDLEAIIIEESERYAKRKTYAKK